MRNEYLPIALSVKDRKCLVVGGGKVALRKIEILLEYDINITVVTPQAEHKIEYFAEEKRLELKKREYKSPEAALFGLVIAASDDANVNEKVAEDARGAGILVNVVDDPAHCDFIFPAVVKRNCMTVAVSSDAKAPFLSGHLRQILEEIFPDHWKKIANLAADFRNRVKARHKGNMILKNACYDRFMAADWKSLIKKSEAELNAELDRLLEG